MKITVTDPIINFAQNAQQPRVSIYYPTHRGGPETRQDPIRLKNLLRQARESLSEAGHEAKADAILKPAWDLVPDTEFWRHQQDGLALFASPGDFRFFHLPFPVPEIVLAAKNFYLKPILPLFSRTEQFYILAISKNQVRLYEANRYSIHHVEAPELPKNFQEAVLQFDDPEQQLQQRSFGPTTGSSAAQQRSFGGSVDRRSGQLADQGATIFHGQGGEKDVHRTDLLRYLKAIDRGFRRHVNGGPQLPLVVAAVDYYLPIYREANSYSKLVEEGVGFGVDALSDKELREKAWPVVHPHLIAGEKKVLERFERVAYNNGEAAEKAARDLEAAVVAAFEGRVDALMIPREEEVWGEFDETTEKVKRETTDPANRCELLDFAAMQTVLHGGEVYFLPKERMPEKVEVAALLRNGGGLSEHG